jgi:glutathione S-transferase
MSLELIELYPSPWSERLRWVLDLKGVPYARRGYQPMADEPEHRRTTGIATAPVLIADGDVIGDSDVSVEWLEAKHPSPALLPSDPSQRAQVRAFETTATEALGPFARHVMVGRMKAMDIQPLANHFATKYGWSPDVEARGTRILTTFLTDLARAVVSRPYLVGDGLTRADVTVAALLIPALGHPPDELYRVDPGLRAMFGTSLADDPALAPLKGWRDELYRRHRGGPVLPA